MTAVQDTTWMNEPIGAQFIANGLQCMMRQTDMHTWCGYVGVPESHVLYGVEYGDLVPYPNVWRDRNVLLDEQGIINVFLAMGADANGKIPDSFAPLTMLLTVHGGLSFSGKHSEFPGLWFFGFDCAHAGDYVPGMHAHLIASGYLSRGPDFAGLGFGDVYRTFDYAQSETISLSDQIAQFVLAPEQAGAMKALLTKAGGLQALINKVSKS